MTFTAKLFEIMNEENILITRIIITVNILFKKTGLTSITKPRENIIIPENNFKFRPCHSDSFHRPNVTTIIVTSISNGII